MFRKHFNRSGRKRPRDDRNGEESDGVESDRGKKRHNSKPRRNNESTSSKGKNVSNSTINRDKRGKSKPSSPNGPVKYPQDTFDNTRKRRQPPTEEAVALSDHLKSLSREKNLDGALNLYWDNSNDTIRDGHHACIMIDIAARCGKIAEGERVVDDMKRRGKFIAVETKTALMKGYSHSGDIAKADALFHAMCVSKSKADHPNVRTLNTLLRGCLWCSASITPDGSVCGGVVSSERAWQVYSRLQPKASGGTSSSMRSFDVSSYEYSIVLLCQALRTDDAETRIAEMKATFNLQNHDELSQDQSLTEALAMVHLALSRAYATLGRERDAISAGKMCLIYSKSSKAALKSSESFSRKRAWKDVSGHNDGRRVESNTIYRDHRLSEVETEAMAIKSICEKNDNAGSFSSRGIARRLITRLVSLSGGGTTSDITTQPGSLTGENDKARTSHSEVSSMIQRGLLTSLYYNYGLRVVIKDLGIPTSTDSGPLSRKECNRILGHVGLQGGIVKDDGMLDVHRIFSAGIGDLKEQKRRAKKKSRRVEIELGAGFGDWIVRKAVEDPATDYIAVELRADRVAQIFSRTAILSSVNQPINNLCIVGGDSGILLRHHLLHGSVDTIYINHPEPPTQTFGANSDSLRRIMGGGDEPAHMLNSSIIVAAANCLRRTTDSRLVIVTDNKWYGRLICATMHKVLRGHPKLLRGVDLNKIDTRYRKAETILNGDDKDALQNLSGDVLMFVGTPNETIGYPSGKKDYGESYFDRLWRAGGGTHAEKRSRFVIVMRSAETSMGDVSTDSFRE